MARIEEVGREQDRRDALEHALLGQDRADHGALGGDFLRHAPARAMRFALALERRRRLRFACDHHHPRLLGGGAPPA